MDLVLETAPSPWEPGPGGVQHVLQAPFRKAERQKKGPKKGSPESLRAPGEKKKIIFGPARCGATHLGPAPSRPIPPG